MDAQPMQGCPADMPCIMTAYCDEVQPGDQLGGRKLRTFQADEHYVVACRHAALACERMWLTLATQRRLDAVKKPGKLALVVGMMFGGLLVSGPNNG